MTATAATRAHPQSVADDVQAVGTAVIFVSLGLSLLNSAGLTTGGTPGIAFLLSYATDLPLGVALFLVICPSTALPGKEWG